jgi:hypothetical protein
MMPTTSASESSYLASVSLEEVSKLVEGSVQAS